MDIKTLARCGLLFCVFFFALQLNGQSGQADTAVQRENAIRVFIDCFYCDINYIREEIPYVNYVRDVKEAQVYILETRELTGSGREDSGRAGRGHPRGGALVRLGQARRHLLRPRRHRA